MSRTRFIFRRFASMILSIVGVSILTFVMMYLTPGDPAAQVLRRRNQHYPSQAELEAFRAEHGLDDPIPIQYLNWMWDILHGDFGVSFFQGVTVSRLIATRLPETVELAVAGMLIALIIALPTGVISAVHKGQIPDYLSQIGSLLGLSMPNFWVGYLLLIVFSLYLDMFPVAGSGGLDHLVLPAVTLGTGMAAVITRLLRSSMLEILDEDYIQTARSKGLRERIVVYKHALRNALIPVVTIIGLQFGYLLNGAVVVEIVFARPGIGKLLIDGIFARDYAIVRGTALLIAVMFVVVNFLVDISYQYIDPRISLEGGRP